MKYTAVRPVLFLLCLLAVSFPSFAQEEPTETYLIVRLQKQEAQSVDKLYYTIEAEPYNTHALDIYDLVHFNKNYFVPKKGTEFYYKHPDSTDQYYNYFKSETEALDFMGRQHWTLVTVLNETLPISGTAPLSGGAPSVAFTTRPVYYFKKTVTPLGDLGIK